MSSLDRVTASWERALEIERKSPRTIEAYLLAASQLADHLKQSGHSLEVPDITRDDIRDFIASVLADRSPSTAKQRLGSLRVLFAFLVAEGESRPAPPMG